MERKWIGMPVKPVSPETTAALDKIIAADRKRVTRGAAFSGAMYGIAIGSFASIVAWTFIALVIIKAVYCHG